MASFSNGKDTSKGTKRKADDVSIAMRVAANSVNKAARSFPPITEVRAQTLANTVHLMSSHAMNFDQGHFERKCNKLSIELARERMKHETTLAAVEAKMKAFADEQAMLLRVNATLVATSKLDEEARAVLEETIDKLQNTVSEINRVNDSMKVHAKDTQRVHERTVKTLHATIDRRGHLQTKLQRKITALKCQLAQKCNELLTLKTRGRLQTKMIMEIASEHIPKGGTFLC